MLEASLRCVANVSAFVADASGDCIAIVGDTSTYDVGAVADVADAAIDRNAGATTNGPTVPVTANNASAVFAANILNNVTNANISANTTPATASDAGADISAITITVSDGVTSTDIKRWYC